MIELNKNVDELKQKYDYQIKITEITFSNISNQINATTLNISVFAFLFSSLAICFGIYITWVERKVIKLRDENKDLLNQSIKNKDDVVALNELIQKDIYGLFIKIKKEETTHLLDRLILVPEDISNLNKTLLSRELSQEDYILLKKAYLKLKSKPEQANTPGFITFSMKYKDSYLLLFFQHFLDLSLKDKDINDDLISFYPNAIECAFENDIIKSTEDFIKTIYTLGYSTKKKEINAFISSISKSKFKNLQIIYDTFFTDLITKDNRFGFYKLLENKDIAKLNFGRLLLTNYQKDKLTVIEEEVIEDIKLLEIEIAKLEIEIS